MIPLVGFLVYTSNKNSMNIDKNKRSLRMLGLWFIPVILIPSIWPIYAILNGQFNEWLSGTLWQATGRQGIGILSMNFIFTMDPILLTLGMTGAIFAAIIKRDFFVMLWIIPFLIFAAYVEWVTYFHWTLLLPAFCIAASVLIDNLLRQINKGKKGLYQILLSYPIISAIAIFGLISTIIFITSNISPAQLEAAAFVAQNVQSINNNKDDITIITGPIYSWIFKYVYDKNHVFTHYRDSSQPIQTSKVILTIDGTYRYTLSNSPMKREIEDPQQIQLLKKIYNSTHSIAIFSDMGTTYNYGIYPYTNIRDCSNFDIEINSNY
jgi:hypothetical protein